MNIILSLEWVGCIKYNDWLHNAIIINKCMEKDARNEMQNKWIEGDAQNKVWKTICIEIYG